MTADRLPEYPFDWDFDARFAAVKAAHAVLMRADTRTSNPTSINAVDDAIEAAVKAYNDTLAEGPGDEPA
jgi:hypothetical protein